MYTKQTWAAREGTGLNRFTDQNGNVLYLTASPDSITAEGTPFTADRMNHMESGIAAIITGGASAPTDGTAGVPGQLYIANSGALYWCVSAGDTYSWKRIGWLDGNGLVPVSCIPALSYIPTSQRDAAYGVAPLDANRKLPLANIPPLAYIPSSQKNAPSGVAPLDASSRLPIANLPALTAVTSIAITSADYASNVCTVALPARAWVAIEVTNGRLIGLYDRATAKIYGLSLYWGGTSGLTYMPAAGAIQSARLYTRTDSTAYYIDISVTSSGVTLNSAHASVSTGTISYTEVRV